MIKSRNYFLLRLTIAFLFTTSTLFAQEVEWQRIIGGSEDDLLYSITQTSDSGYILGGWSVSSISGDKTANCEGNYDYWIVKTDAFGNIQWQNTIGGSGYDFFTTGEKTSDGGYLLGGYSESNISGDKTEINFGLYDYWIVKVDSVGNVQWQNTIGGTGTDFLYSVKQTSDGGYILGGQSDSPISGDKTENSNGLYDYWIVKTDSIGNIQWQNTIGGSNEDKLSSVKQTSNGGYILGGSSASGVSGDKSENSKGSYDYWIVNTDALGNVQWQNTIGGSLEDKLISIEETKDGGYILGGDSKSNITGDKIENCQGSFDFWIVKTDAFGNIQWQNTIGGYGFENNAVIEHTKDGGYFLGGASTSGWSIDKSEGTNGNYDIWAMKTDSIGNLLWQNTIGSIGADYLYSFEQTFENDYILGGFSKSDISGDKTENSKGYNDYWIIKLTDKYNLITGKLFADVNANNVQDNGEPVLPNQKIVEQNTGRFSFTNQDGKYYVSVLDSGNFTVSALPLNWYSPTPLNQSALFNNINQVDSLNDFAFQPVGTYNDVFVKITPLTNFRSGFAAIYQITYGNKGTTTITPTILFYPDTNVTFQSSTLTPTTVYPDSIIWNLPSITPFQTGSFVIKVNVDLGLSIGTLVNSGVYIEPLSTDDNPTNNISNWEVFTRGSFDPNDILVNKAKLTTTELSTSPWLDYLIRFQNTGNDTAFTVKILNPIDTNKLDISTIEFVNASHPVNLSWINYQRNMEFKFDNILLVDSNMNEPLSHGFVQYRIKPKTNLLVGDIIKNQAAIYFDFNEPVITNFAETIIILPTGLSSASSTNKLIVFPNPTESKINIQGIPLTNGKASVFILDIYGKQILEQTINDTYTEIEISKLASGLYLIQAGSLRTSFVKL
jgi:hypothetical protein